MIKRFEGPLLWLCFFLILGGAVSLNLPFVLLIAAIIIHFL